MEGYGLDELAASADAVVAGLGPLAVQLARLAGEAGRAVTLDAMELLVAGRGREILRGVVQLSLDAQAGAEVRLPRVTGADGVPRARAERGHSRLVVTTLGAVRVRRIAYRSGVKGARSLFPRDAALNLPPCGYSWQLQRLAEMSSRCGSYAQAHEFVLAATGVSIGKRQLEQVTVAAAADAERFCQDQNRPRDHLAVSGTGQDLPPLAISADGKGVAMRPEARRRREQACHLHHHPAQPGSHRIPGRLQRRHRRLPARRVPFHPRLPSIRPVLANQDRTERKPHPHPDTPPPTQLTAKEPHPWGSVNL